MAIYRQRSKRTKNKMTTRIEGYFSECRQDNWYNKLWNKHKMGNTNGIRDNMLWYIEIWIKKDERNIAVKIKLELNIKNLRRKTRIKQ